MPIHRICVISKDGIADNDARPGVEEQTPVIVLPYKETRDLGASGQALFIHDRDTVQATMDGVTPPFSWRVLRDTRLSVS